MGDLAKPTYQKACQTVKRIFIRCLPHALLCIAYLLYLIIGTVIFQAVEGHGSSQLEDYLDNVANMRGQLEDAMWNETNGVNTNWTQLLEDYTDMVSMPEWKLGRLQAVQDGVAWSFSSTMLFCLITITTIGYGDIVPVTTGGKVFVGFYATFGIPLNVIFLADIGYLLAKLLIRCISAYNRCKSKKQKTNTKLSRRGMQEPPKKRRLLGGISDSRAMSVHGPRSISVVADEPDKPCPRDQGSIRRGKHHNITISGMMTTFGPKSVVSKPQNRAESKSVVVNSSTKSSEEPRKHNSMYPQIQDTSFIDDQKAGASGFENVPLEDVESGLVVPNGGPVSGKKEEVKFSEKTENMQATDKALEDTMDIQEMQDDHTEVPLYIVLVILIVYVLLGSLMIMAIENPWTYGESLYFTFITLTTIGFGDMIPVNHYDENVFFFCIIYTVVGLAVMSTCIALVQAKVLRAIDRFTAWIKVYS